MKTILFVTFVLNMTTSVYAFNLKDALKDQAMDSVKDQAASSIKDQAVDKGVDMGSEYAKSAIKSAGNNSTSTPTITDMAIKAAAGSNMADSTIDTGADYSKGAIKKMIK